MASGVKAGKAWVEIHGDNNPLSRALAAAGKKLKHWGANVTKIGLATAAAGSAALAPIIGAAKVFAKAGDDVEKMGKRIGASAEFVSALGHAAALGGTDIAAMETGIRRMQRSAFDAANGSKAATLAFDTLGVSVHDANGQLKTTETLFMETAAGLAKLENNTEKAAIASMLFGRAGTSLLPMLHDGARGLEAAMEEAKRLGLVMSTEDATAAAALTDSMLRMTSTVKRLYVQIGASLAPTLTAFFDRLAPLVTKTIDWVRENKALVTTVAAISAGLVAAGGGLLVMGGTLSAAGIVAGGFAVAIGVLKAGLLFLLTPVGLVIAGLVALGAYAIHSAGGIKKVFARLAESLAPLTEIFTASLGAMKDALVAGDFSLAGKVLWSSLKVTWLEGTSSLHKLWIDFKHTTMQVWNDLTVSIKSVWMDFTSQLRVQWLDLTDAMTAGLDNVSRKAAKTMTWVMAKLQGKDTNKALAFVDYAFDSKKGKREQEYIANMKELARQREAAAKALQDGKEGTAGVIEDMRSEAHRAAESSLAQARDEWQAAMTEAHAAGDAARATDSATSEKAIETDPERIRATSGSVRGTFSAAAVAGLGNSDDTKRTANATERSAELLKRIQQQLQNLAPVFD